MRFSGFINRYGLKKNEGLNKVELFDISVPKLPGRDITVHYTKEGLVDNQTLKRDYTYLNTTIAKSYISIYPRFDFELIQGKGKRVSFNANGAINHRVNQLDFASKCLNLEKDIEQNNKVVVNDYTFLNQMFTYGSYKLNIYDEWFNIFTQVVKGIEDIEARKDNLLWVELPRHIPKLSMFRKCEDDIPTTLLSEWNSYNGFTLLDIFRFIKGKGLLSSLISRDIDKTTLMILDGSKVAFIPLSHLREVEDDELEDTSKLFMERFYDILEMFLEARNNQDTEILEDLYVEDFDTSTSEDRSNTPYVKRYVNTLSEQGLLTTQEKNNIEKLVKVQEELKDPDTLDSIYTDLEVKPHEEVIEPEILSPVKNTINKGYLKSSVKNWDETYIENKLMDKHIKQMLLSMPNGGVFITNIEKVPYKDPQNNHVEYKLNLQPIQGKKSTVRFIIPEFDKDGLFKSAGVNYSLDNQKRDTPIRKVKSWKVGLMSYAGKMFVQRNQMKAYDTYNKMAERAVKLALDPNTPFKSRQFGSIKKIPVGYDLPLHYTRLGQSFISITKGNFRFNFDFHKRDQLFDKPLKSIEPKGMVLCGINAGKPLLMDKDGFVHLEGKVAGHIEEMLTGERNPVNNYAEINLLGKNIPVGFALAYLLGITKLVKILKVNYDIYPIGETFKKSPDDVVIKTKDKTVVITNPSNKDRLILNGFVRLAKELKQVTLSQLDQGAIYASLVTKFRGGSFNLKEIEHANNMFIDPITKRVLKEIKEPTKFIPLIIRAVELLTSDDVPDETDTRFVRICGLERVSGMVYNEIYQAMRLYNNNPNPRLATINIKPYAVRAKLTTDAIVVDEINPVHSLKEAEAITLGGDQGQSMVSLVKASRAYHKNDLGIISEATPDSSKTGVRTHATPNAKLNNIYGLYTGSYDPEKDDTSSLISTTSLLYPGLNHDDAKRVNLCSVITSSMVAANGYQLHPYRTGYEQAIASRNKNSFAHNFHDDGVVTELTKDRIVIKDSEGIEYGIPLGVQHGTSGGSILPHEIATEFKKGDKVKKGDIVAYNKNYFTPDEFNPGNVSLMSGTPAMVVFQETEGTFEDASKVDEALLSQVKTKDTKRKVIVVNNDDMVLGLLSVNASINVNDPICSIQKVHIGAIDKSDLNAFNTLEKFSSNVPKSKVNGTISKIEVFYCGEVNTFDKTVQAIIEAENKRLKSLKRQLKQDILTTCKLDRPGFVYGSKIDINQCAIVVYIDHELEASTGDKLVLGPQLKTIISDTMSSKTKTESGLPINMVFSYAGEANRIVLSTRIQGTVGLIQKQLSKRMAEAYFE